MNSQVQDVFSKKFIATEICILIIIIATCFFLQFDAAIGSDRSGSITIPSNSSMHDSALYSASNLTNGLSSLHLSNSNSASGNSTLGLMNSSVIGNNPMGPIGSNYNTPPKPSLLDSIGLSESPVDSIWAPAPEMLKKMAMTNKKTNNGSNNGLVLGGGNFTGIVNNSSNASTQQQLLYQQQANIFSLLQQQPSVANQQQITTNFNQQPQGSTNASNRIPSLLSDDLTKRQQQSQQVHSLGMNASIINGPFGGLEKGVVGPGVLPLGISGNVKSVADLELEMKLQQLKNTTPLESVSIMQYYFLLVAAKV